MDETQDIRSFNEIDCDGVEEGQSASSVSLPEAVQYVLMGKYAEDGGNAIPGKYSSLRGTYWGVPSHVQKEIPCTISSAAVPRRFTARATPTLVQSELRWMK